MPVADTESAPRPLCPGREAAHHPVSRSLPTPPAQTTDAAPFARASHSGRPALTGDTRTRPADRGAPITRQGGRADVEGRRGAGHRHLPGPQLRHVEADHRRRASPAWATPRSTAASWRSWPTSSEHVCPLLIGRDAGAIEDTWRYLYNGRLLAARPGDDDGDRRRRHRAMGHQGQGAGLPVYELLGGALPRRRDGLRPRQRRDGRRRARRRGRYVDLGYEAVRVQCGDPGAAQRPTA